VSDTSEWSPVFEWKHESRQRMTGVR